MKGYGGIDRGRGVWVFIYFGEERGVGVPFYEGVFPNGKRFYGSLTVSPKLDFLLREFGEKCRWIWIDIPIGFSSSGKEREADRLARKVLGKRGSSLFPVPSREVALSLLSPMGEKLSFRGRKRFPVPLQTVGIVPQIVEVEELFYSSDLSPIVQKKMRESHPEVCFWVINGKKPLREGKQKRRGSEERLFLLRTVFPDLPPFLPDLWNVVKKVFPSPRPFQIHDLLDGIVLALSAFLGDLYGVDSFPPETTPSPQRIFYPLLPETGLK